MEAEERCFWPGNKFTVIFHMLLILSLFMSWLIMMMARTDKIVVKEKKRYMHISYSVRCFVFCFFLSMLTGGSNFHSFMIGKPRKLNPRNKNLYASSHVREGHGHHDL